MVIVKQKKKLSTIDLEELTNINIQHKLWSSLLIVIITATTACTWFWL